jgi:HEAT repeat protein
VADFIRALALAWKNLAAYPPGHPALAGAVEAAHRALMDLRGPAGEVALGIAADGILYGDDKIDSTQAQKFAQALYGRGIAVVRFAAETTTADLDTFLRRLTGTPENPTPLWEELTAAGVVNINLKPVDYSAVQVTDKLTDEPQERQSLWEDILRALVAGHELTPKARRLLSRDIRSVDELAAIMLRYIDSADDPSAEFDPDATFGVRIETSVPQTESAEAMIARVADSIGTHVASSSGSRRQVAVQQIIQLLRVMPDALRRTIVRAALRPLATDPTAGSLMRELSNTLQRDEVLEALRHLSMMGNLSPHAIALLESLASIEARSSEPQPAPAALLGELVELFEDEDIDRFNPPDHKALLSEVSIELPRLQTTSEQSIEKLGNRVETVAPEAVDRQLGQTLIELLSKFGTSRDVEKILERAASLLRAEITGGEFVEAVNFVHRLEQVGATAQKPELREAIIHCLAGVATPDATQALIASLATAPPDETAAIRRLVEALGAAAARSLLVALSEESNRSRRRRLFDLLASLGPRIVPDVVPLLHDKRWYVVRNMLLLLRSVNDRTSLAEVRRVAQHGDLRVRMEAIKTLLAYDESVPTALLEEAVNDRDPKLAETAIALVGSYGIKEAVGPLLRILKRRDLFGKRRSLRVRVIKALGELADPLALSQMDSLFSTSFLPWPAKEERHAAFESLAGYPPDARAPLVERGLKARDPQIREICRKLRNE